MQHEVCSAPAGSCCLISTISLMNNQADHLKNMESPPVNAKLRVKENGGMMISYTHSHTYDQFNNNSRYLRLHLSGGGGF